MLHSVGVSQSVVVDKLGVFHRLATLPPVEFKVEFNGLVTIDCALPLRLDTLRFVDNDLPDPMLMSPRVLVCLMPWYRASCSLVVLCLFNFVDKRLLSMGAKTVWTLLEK